MENKLLAAFKQIKTFVFDLDGVFTDGNLIVFENGKLSRRFNVKDGYAVKRATKLGWRVAIITGGMAEGTNDRFASLGVHDIYRGVAHKPDAFEELALTYDLLPEEVLYMGDDLPDIGLLQTVGLPCCPANAAPEVRQACRYISPLKGGEGCVRDVVEKVLKLNGNWSKGPG